MPRVTVRFLLSNFIYRFLQILEILVKERVQWLRQIATTAMQTALFELIMMSDKSNR